MFVVGCSVTFVGVYFITADRSKYGKPVDARASTIMLPGTIPIIHSDMPSEAPHFYSAVSLKTVDEVPSDRTINESQSQPISYESFDSRRNPLKLVIPSDVGFQEVGSSGRQSMLSWLDEPDQLNRLSRTGAMGLANILNALGTTRASLSFQQVALQREKMFQQFGTSLGSDTQTMDDPTEVVIVRPVSNDSEVNPNDVVDARTAIQSSIEASKAKAKDYEVVHAFNEETNERAILVRPVEEDASLGSRPPSFVIHPIPENWDNQTGYEDDVQEDTSLITRNKDDRKRRFKGKRPKSHDA